MSSQAQAVPKLRPVNPNQESAYKSPWPKQILLRMLLWNIASVTLFRWTPKPCFKWRAFLLKMFGAKIARGAFVASSASIKMPWNLEMAEQSCIGPDATVYNLAPVRIGRRSTVAQEVYLCGGSHDFSRPTLALIVGEIEIGDDVFIGARAFIHPGVTLSNGVIVGACSVVTSDVREWTVAVGTPCRPIKERPRYPALAEM
jgi:putative colanic acid biosynthesis acetyltransferase WcaF